MKQEYVSLSCDLETTVKTLSPAQLLLLKQLVEECIEGCIHNAAEYAKAAADDHTALLISFGRSPL